jgi:hypothetical protein
MSNIKSFIDELKQLNEKDCINAFIPSLKKSSPFKVLSVKQHRDIIKTVVDGVEGSILISKVFNDIVTENSIKEVTFKLYDRNKILLDMRKEILGDKVTVNNNSYSLNTLPTYNFTPEDTKEFEYNGIKVLAEIPTLDIDSKITEKSVVEISKFSAEDNKVGNSINVLLVYELIKFIKTIELQDSVLLFSDLSTYDKKTIVENLPIKLNNMVLDFIAKYKEQEQEFYTFSDGTKLSIDAGFLTGE